MFGQWTRSPLKSQSQRSRGQLGRGDQLEDQELPEPGASLSLCLGRLPNLGVCVCFRGGRPLVEEVYS